MKNLPYKLGLNKFAFLSLEEFNKIYANKAISNERLYPEKKISEEDTNEDRNEKRVKGHKKNRLGAYESKDWSYLLGGIVAAQGNCGSCWAVSTVSALEAYLHQRYGKYQALSVQNIIDCEDSYQTCEDGSFCHVALDFIKKNGIAKDEDYLYTDKKDKCNHKPKRYAFITDYDFCPYSMSGINHDCTERDVKNAIVRGPYLSSVQTSDDFRFYKEGILDVECDGPTTHAILVTQYVANKYYKVLNSWGDDWGIDGYIKISTKTKGKLTACGLGDEIYSIKLILDNFYSIYKTNRN